MEELGIDRPALFFLVSGVALLGDDGGRMSDITNPYPTLFDANLAAASAARGAGLIEEVGDRWRATAKGRDVAARFRAEADTFYATLEPIPQAELSRLADRLGKALKAIEASDVPKEHMRRTPHYRGDDRIPMAALDNAVFGLWQARDDCHMSSWREAGFTGPVFDVLTRVWRNEAASEEELVKKLPVQRPEDVRSALARLRADAMLEPGALRLTERGSSQRQRIEDETDRRFFSPWPSDLAAEAPWIVERLRSVNAALAPRA